MKKWLTIAALALVGWAAPASAQDVDVELTGWPTKWMWSGKTLNASQVRLV